MDVTAFTTGLASRNVETNYRLVAALSASFFAIIKFVFGKRGGVDWYAVVHAFIATVGSTLCLFIDFYADSIDPGGVGEPLRAIRCANALTPVHSLVPMISLGYAALDLFDGLYTSRLDFVLHGLTMVSVLAFLCEIGKVHLIVSTLVMEMSTIPLNLLKYKFDRPMMSIANTVIFIITFFLSRLIVFPWLWGRWIWTYYEEITDDGPESCYPSYFIYIVVSIGLVFHGLNIFWMFRIIKGAIKKIRGAFSNTHRKNN